MGVNWKMKTETKERIRNIGEDVKTFFARHRPLLFEDRRQVLSFDRTDRLIRRGRRAVRMLDAGSRQAVICQYRLLRELLAENQDTEYGRKYGFSGIHTAEEYKERVPLSEYDDYEPYIRRMMDGEKNILCARDPKHFAISTGSVGVSKYVPVTQEELDKYTRYSGEMAFGVADEYYRNTTGRGVPAGYGLNAIELQVLPTSSGVNKGAISSTLLTSMKDSVPDLLSSPWEVICPGQESEIDMKYLKTRFALEDRKLVFMDAVFMSGLVDLMDYIRENYELLCRDIYYGRIDESVKMPEEMREVMTRYLKPQNPAGQSARRKRAKELLREFREGFEKPIIPRIWPKMSWIGGIGTGGFFPYARKMRKYSGKSIPFNNLCYAASESFIAAARHMGDESYVLIPDGGFYEFLPVESEDETRTLNIDELEAGEDYRVIVTNLSGFYRYRLHDVVRVTGYYNETPMIRFIYRENQLVSIAGEKTNEEDLRWAVEQFYLQTRIHISDYSIFADTESSPGHYVVLLEPDRVIPEERIPYCRDVLEEKLMQANPAYGEMIRKKLLGKLELVFLEQQTYQLYRDLQIMKGVSPNQIKPVRVIDTPQKEKFFLHLREKYD